jgi:hypothetical protein
MPLERRGAWICLATALATGCTTPSMLGELTMGGVTPVGNSRSSDRGFGFQAVAGVDHASVHMSVRAVDDTSEVATGVGVFGVGVASRHVSFFGRLAVNLLEWDRVGDVDRIGALGPTAELGVVFVRKHTGGPCVAIAASHDFRLAEQDDSFLGVNLGVCAAVPEVRH